jgi:hypothetical protein
MNCCTNAALRFRTAVLCAALMLVAIVGVAGSALAQTPNALPTAPDASPKAAQGGYTAARASLPGDSGSPLEPYLFLFILAGGGIVAWGLAISTDIRLRRGSRPAR